MKTEQQNDDPITGVFIIGREIKNDGEIRSEGSRPITHIETEKYSGTGKITSIQTNKKIEKWHQKWWAQIIFLVIAGLLVAYLVYTLGWT